MSARGALGLEALGLRTRFALFFALIGAGALLALIAAGAVALSRLGPESLPHLVFAGLLAAGAIGGLVLWVALKFDEHVARPIAAMASQMRVALHCEVSGALAPETGRYLGLLAPTLSGVTEALRDAREAREAAIEAALAEARTEAARLQAVIRDLDRAVLVCSLAHEVLLYNRRALAAFGPERLGLGRGADRLIEGPALHGAVEALLAQSRAARAAGENPVCAAPFEAREARGRMSLVLDPDGDDAPLGYALILDEPAPPERASVPERPEYHDFARLKVAPAKDIRDRPLKAAAICVFDTETTGLDPRADALVSIAGVRVLNGRVLLGETFEALIRPPRPIPIAAARIHGITDAMVAEAPQAGAVLPRFLGFAEGAALAGHNVAFDLAFLAQAGAAPDAPALDTVLLGAHLFGADASLSLDALAERLGVAIAPADRHTALGDAIATARVLTRLIDLLVAADVSTIGAAIAAGERQAALRRAQARQLES